MKNKLRNGWISLDLSWNQVGLSVSFGPTKIPIAGALGVGNGPKCHKLGISGYGSKVVDLGGSGLDLNGTYLHIRSVGTILTHQNCHRRGLGAFINSVFSSFVS